MLLVVLWGPEMFQIKQVKIKFFGVLKLIYSIRATDSTAQFINNSELEVRNLHT